MQVSIGGRDHAHVRCDHLVAAHPLELPLLQNTEQSDLCLLRQFADFVEENRAPLRQFEAPPAAVESRR